MAAGGNFELGAVVQLSRYFRFTYRNVLRSPEFKSTTNTTPLADAHTHCFESLTLELGCIV